MTITGAEIIVEALLEQGVDTVFGYPGGAVLNIYDALYKYQNQIRHILTAHEQGAAFAADGYARSTGRTGVVIATSGPGATNLVTGIADAYMDSIPMVAITGNVATHLLGRDSFQEVDITGVTMPVTKHNFIVKDVNELAATIRRAFSIANSGRKGPVLVDVPKDITAATAEFTRQKPELAPPVIYSSENRLQKAIDVIANAKRPVIYAGGGVILSGASESLLRFAHKTDTPVACSMMGLGGFPAEDDLYLGLIGMHGEVAANEAAYESDVLIVAGARFSDRVAGNRSKFAPNAHVVHIDIDSAEHDKNVPTGTRVTGDLKLVLDYLCERLPQISHKDWLKHVDTLRREEPQPTEGEYITPFEVIGALNSLLKPEDIVVTDVGQHQMWTAQHYKFQKPRTLLTSGGLGAMGFGLGAAIGAQIGNPGQRVALISGDGSFHMNLNEITTIASYDLPIVDIVLNNQVLGMVRQWQKVFYDCHFSQTDPHRKTDIAALAEAFGIKGMRMTRREEVLPMLQEAFCLQKPVVIDCRISPDANVLPMIPPGGAVQDTIDVIME